MDKSWIKLFRRLADHPIMKDPTALQIFIWILLKVNKETGTMTMGRFLAAEILGINPNTYKDALKRLVKKYKIVTTKRHHKGYTEISVLNWAKYQVQKETTPQSDTSQTPHNKKYISIPNTKHGVDSNDNKKSSGKNSSSSNLTPKQERFVFIMLQAGLPDPTPYLYSEAAYINSLTTDQAMKYAEVRFI